MKIGTTIQNETMTLTVVAYHETRKGNVALLIRSTDTPYVCVRDLTRQKSGDYHWYYGHYINDFEVAAQDFIERKLTLS